MDKPSRPQIPATGGCRSHGTDSLLDVDTTPFGDLLAGAHSLDGWRAGGVSRHELAQVIGRRAHRGRWAFAGADAVDPLQRALEDASLLPPDGALGGWGAAQVLGIRWLDGTDPGGAVRPGLLCLPPHRLVRRPGVRTLRSRLDVGDVVMVRGSDVRVTSPVRTAFDLARTAPDLRGAVESLDCIVAHGVPAAEVAAYAQERVRYAGAPQARLATGLATGRIRSPAESRLRMMWVLDAGLPTPAVNASVLDGSGRLVAEVDLLDPRTGLVGEYDGSPHSGAAARSKDRQRQERLERLGLTFVRCVATEIHEVDRTVARLREGAARAEALTARGVRLWTAMQLAVPGRDLRPFRVV